MTMTDLPFRGPGRTAVCRGKLQQDRKDLCFYLISRAIFLSLKRRKLVYLCSLSEVSLPAARRGVLAGYHLLARHCRGRGPLIHYTGGESLTWHAWVQATGLAPGMVRETCLAPWRGFCLAVITATQSFFIPLSYYHTSY